VIEFINYYIAGSKVKKIFHPRCSVFGLSYVIVSTMRKYFYILIALCMVAIPNRKKDEPVHIDEEILFI